MGNNKKNCPYCDIILNPVPVRKTKCKNCKNDIYIKYLLETKESILATKEQADKIDNELKLNNFINKWKHKIFDEYKFPIEEYEKIKKNSPSPFEKEHLYRALTSLIHDFTEKNNYQRLSSLYYSMALFIAEEGRSGYFQFLELSKKYELYEIKQNEKTLEMKLKVKISSAGIGNACEECLKIENKLYTIDEALKVMPIPNKNCTKILYNYPFCRCCWVFEMIE